jgi:hypothetical protein
LRVKPLSPKRVAYNVPDRLSDAAAALHKAVAEPKRGESSTAPKR